MPYLDSSDGEWYLKQVVSISEQSRRGGIDPRVFAADGMIPADSQLICVILTKLRMFLDCCRPFKDLAYVKVTPTDNALSLGLVVRVDEEGGRIIRERTERFGSVLGHAISGVVNVDDLDEVDGLAMT
ncbi:hypothetical protein MMC11_002057 [Xylographa trunciseda]|nr:hypothetical protein [Xylographa trunciseda]